MKNKPIKMLLKLKLCLHNTAVCRSFISFNKYSLQYAETLLFLKLYLHLSTNKRFSYKIKVSRNSAKIIFRILGKLPTRKLPPRWFPPDNSHLENSYLRKFSPRITATRKISTQDNSHPDNSNPENSCPGYLPPGKFPPN